MYKKLPQFNHRRWILMLVLVMAMADLMVVFCPFFRGGNFTFFLLVIGLVCPIPVILLLAKSREKLLFRLAVLIPVAGWLAFKIWFMHQFLANAC